MVRDVHELVAQVPLPIAPEGVKLYEPKFSPVIVTERPPDVAPFASFTKLTTGLSNVKSLCDVPTTAPSVRDVTNFASMLPVGVLEWHCSVVPDVHALVVQAALSMPAVGVKWYLPKFSPLIVTDRPPVMTALPLPGTALSAGASKLKATELVAASTWTHSSLFLAVSARAVVAAPIWQDTVVAEVHEVV